jgi:hypothetical protein
MGNYLKTITVPIPVEDKLVVIRKGERVEYEIDRTYSPEEQNTRVKRKVIGKVDPVQAGRMFPNEAYFELFPENEVPEEIRNEFLRECAIRRQMKVIRQNPEDIADQVINGLGAMNSELENRRSLDFARDDTGDSRENKGVERKYTITRRVFDEIYYAIEELAGKFPNEVIDPFKVERINEVLSELRGLSARNRTRTAAGDSTHNGPLSATGGGPICAAHAPHATSPSTPSGIDPIQKHLRLIEEGLTYSDVLLMLKWYKVLPR